MAFRTLCALALTAAGLSACASLPEARAPHDGAMPVFSSDADIERFMRRMDIAASEADKYRPKNDGTGVIVVTGSRVEPPNITNVQEADVDEGAIVKNIGEYFVVLRRGRLFTIRHGGDELSAVDAINAFPPGDDEPDDTWYDEMLVSGDIILVIGYSYGEDGSEISRFRIDGEGRLSYVDTHYMRSEDYYSSENYASRLIDGHLVLYAPVDMDPEDWRAGLPSIARRLEDGSQGEPQKLGRASELAVPVPYLEKPFRGLDFLHTVTSCDVEDPAFACSSRMVLGSWTRNFYVSRDAVYVWTEPADYVFTTDGEKPVPMLYRIPTDPDEAVTGIGVSGNPVDQFSFLEDLDEDLLHVAVFEFGYGDAMWGSHFRSGDAALLQLPLDSFGDGSESAPPSAYRGLPAIDGWGVENRYVGRFLLLGTEECDESEVPCLFSVPLDHNWVQRLPVSHEVSRLDRLVNDGVAIGVRNAREDDLALGFSSIRLDEESGLAELIGTHFLAAAGESENRSQAFYYRPDEATPEGESGIMALPVSVYSEDDEMEERWGRDNWLYFVRREDRELSELGELRSNYGRAPDDACAASCTDWYGNARPIFLGDRIFALMGYELIEGRFAEGRIEEIRRVDFTPAGGTFRQGD